MNISEKGIVLMIDHGCSNNSGIGITNESVTAPMIAEYYVCHRYLQCHGGKAERLVNGGTAGTSLSKVVTKRIPNGHRR